MDRFYNAPLIAAAASWFAAQLIKNIMYFCRNGKINIERLWGAGGMPSSHAAAVCALAASMAETEGVTSAAFALAAILALVVMYDASGVRRAAGMHAKEINRIRSIVEELDAEIPNAGAIRQAPETEKAEKIDKAGIEEKTAQLKEFLGHSPLEVFFGAMLGIIIGLII